MGTMFDFMDAYANYLFSDRDNSVIYVDDFTVRDEDPVSSNTTSLEAIQ